jgi:UDP-N-acetylmuramate dehydrogenase
VRIYFEEPLDIHTTLGVGGPARMWVQPNNMQQLRKLVCYFADKQMLYLVIGRGSNILFSDQGFKGAVICLNTPGFTKMEVKRNLVSVGTGLSLKKLLGQLQKVGLGGLEFLAGIPASVGGALVMNAGNYSNNIGNFVIGVTVMDKRGKVYNIKTEKLRFGYRQSNLNQYIILEVLLKLTKRSPQLIRNNIIVYLKEKRKTQDLKAKSAGCIFKNPQHYLTAAEMIDYCGLKGKRRGGAEISVKHANYIINRNGARANDVLYLINLIQREVQSKFGVNLKPEIKIIGDGSA